MKWKVIFVSFPGLARAWTQSFETKREANTLVQLYQQVCRVGRTYFIWGR